MRYRIVIEVDTDESREWINGLAVSLMNDTVTTRSNPVYLATEVVEDNKRKVIRKK